MKRIAILGASGHGKVIAEIAELIGFEEVVFFDDAWTGHESPDEGIEETQASGFPWKVVGNTETLLASVGEFDTCFVGIGNNGVRWGKQRLLKQSGAHLKQLIHPTATVSKYAVVGEGSVVMANAVINPFAKIGAACIVNTASTIDHDCILNHAVHVSAGANLGGGVEVGSESWVGIRSCVRQYLKIGSGVTVGAGAAVVKDVPDNETVVGIPARSQSKC